MNEFFLKELVNIDSSTELEVLQGIKWTYLLSL